jgi:hypothetical protein
MGNATREKITKRLWPIGIIIVMWLAFAFPYWGKGLIPFPSKYLVTFFAPWSASHGMPVKNNAMPDVITQIYPWKRVTIDAWKRGELPLWNPYSFSGTSHVGNYQSAIFSPLNLLFLILPEIHAWSIMILLQPILAGLFMYLFLRSLSISTSGSVMGSFAFMFCGFIVVWMAYGTLAYAVLFLPLILFGINKRVMVLISAAVALSFLSGHFQMSLYVLLFAISYILYRKEWRALLFVCLGLLLAAPQILPSFDAYAQAVRSSLFVKGEVIPWQYAVTIFSPDFYGNPVTRNDWFGHYAEWASFIGVVPLFLALIRPVKFFALAAVICLLFAFQTPLVDLLFALKIPVLSTSAASRIIVLVSFSLSVLSGFGLDRLREYWQARAWKKIRAHSLVAIIFAVGVWFALIFLRPLPAEKLTVAMRNSVLPTLILGFVLAVVAIGFFLPKKLREYLPYILIIAAAFDLYRFASKWMPFDPASYIYPELPVLTKVKSLIASDGSRVFGNIGNEVGSAFGIPLVEGYDAVYQRRYGEFIASIATGKPEQVTRSVVTLGKRSLYSEDTLEFLGVRYYLHKKSDGRLPWAYPFWEFPNYRRVWEDDNFEIYENTKSLSRAFLASSYQVLSDDQAMLNAFFPPGLDKKETLLLERKPTIEPQAGEGRARISRYTSNNVTIETESPVPKLLFLSDVYDAGWQVTVDGGKAELLRADYDFRAVAVRAGKHVVHMYYWPKSLTLGFSLSLFATLTLVFLSNRKEKHGKFY